MAKTFAKRSTVGGDDVPDDLGFASELWRFPLHGCWINRNLEKTGRAFVYLNRLLRNGGLVGAGFLIDLRGGGVTDCFQTRDVPVCQLNSLSRAKVFGGRMAECSEERARRLVWGGFWRARALGVRPPAQFRYCCELLERLGQEEVDEGLFGKNGDDLNVARQPDPRGGAAPSPWDREEFESLAGI